MLMDSQVTINALMKSIEEQKSDRTTYADTVAEGSKSQNVYMCGVHVNDRKSLYSIVVSSQDVMETGEEVLEKVRQAVEAKEGWVKVERVRKAKDRKVIMGCSTKARRSSYSQPQENMKNKEPLLILKGVLKMHTDEVVRALKNQNREVFHGLNGEDCRIEVKYRKQTRNPHTEHIVVTVSPIIWGRATERGRLRVDLQSVFVEDQSPLVQCSRCLGYGHSRKFCRETADLCSHCGGLHLCADCPERVKGGPPQCINCKRAGREGANHNAFYKECAIRKRRDEIARASIQYR